MAVWEAVELPGFDAPLAAMAPERVRALADHLEQLVESLNVSRLSTEPLAPEPEHVPDASDIEPACSACRGHCCRNGGNIAYLNLKAVARVWNGLAQPSREMLVEAYAGAVPDRAFAGSCIFHTEQGCNLPRSMRSDICLDYLCPPLWQARSTGGPDRAPPRPPGAIHNEKEIG